METCTQTRKHKYASTIPISSWQCNYSKKRLLFHRLENSAKTTDFLLSGSTVKNNDWPKRRRQLYAKRTVSYRLFFTGCPPILVAVRLQHRHCSVRLQQVQPKSEVTGQFQETGADDSQKPKTKIKRGMAVATRTDRLRDFPEWLEEFTDNLEDTEVSAPAHTSQDSERPTKVG